jgi:hypothetical protein
LDNWLEKDPTSLCVSANKKASKKCAAHLKRSLSEQVHAGIPSSIIDSSPSRPDLLWTHLNCSSGTSLRKFELAQTLFRFNVPDDQDPAPHIATMTSAHRQLGGGNMLDSLFALALAMLLPASFDQQKQALWMQGDKLTSDMVATAARGEWSRRSNDIAAEANKASVKPTSAQANSASQRGGDRRDNKRNNNNNNNNNKKTSGKHCNLHPSLDNHNTADLLQHVNEGVKGKAKANKAKASSSC